MHCVCQEKQTVSPEGMCPESFSTSVARVLKNEWVAGATRLVFKANKKIKFEFISAESSNKTATRSKIRSHVMKHVRDTQALEHVASSRRKQQAPWRLTESSSGSRWAHPHGNSPLKSSSACTRCGKPTAELTTTNQTSQIQSALQGLVSSIARI